MSRKINLNIHLLRNKFLLYVLEKCHAVLEIQNRLRSDLGSIAVSDSLSRGFELLNLNISSHR